MDGELTEADIPVSFLGNPTLEVFNTMNLKFVMLYQPYEHINGR